MEGAKKIETKKERELTIEIADIPGIEEALVSQCVTDEYLKSLFVYWETGDKGIIGYFPWRMKSNEHTGYKN